MRLASSRIALRGRFEVAAQVLNRTRPSGCGKPNMSVGDRILHEALSTNADPLHLTVMFGLSEKSAADYARLARGIKERPVEAVGHYPTRWD
ncbi:hypothetical protein ACWEKR_32955 [Nocardia sp. NPDC004573]